MYVVLFLRVQHVVTSWRAVRLPQSALKCPVPCLYQDPVCAAVCASYSSLGVLHVALPAPGPSLHVLLCTPHTVAQGVWEVMLPVPGPPLHVLLCALTESLPGSETLSRRPFWSRWPGSFLHCSLLPARQQCSSTQEAWQRKASAQAAGWTVAHLWQRLDLQSAACRGLLSE